MAFYIYVIRSLEYNNNYIGSTENVEKRLKEHNAGKCRYTSGRCPWVLAYQEEYPTRGEAMKREKFLKSGQGRKFLKDRILV
ncbi:MAG: GIY-YIG nuclease family protein [Candidatus Margulisbacteria bacterium]|nr:GIY-YIG nuclease family protein [Candidatus Margulisiibacteriota bacterium]